MDEVLVDFVSGACEIHGTTREELTKKWPVGHWSIVEVLGLFKSEFWNRINKEGEDFWFNLKPLPWCNDLLELVKSTTDDWHIVTAPSMAISCYSGKVRWLKTYFNPGFDRFVITPHKYLFAQPGIVLIDDREENVLDFVKSGGEGLVFPTHGNRFHEYKEDPVASIADVLTRSR